MNVPTKLAIKNSTLYESLKYTTQIALPATGTLYFTLSQIWGLPHGEEVVGTIVALTAFLGVMLGVSTAAYRNSDARFDGAIDVVEGPDHTTFTLNMDEDPYELRNMDEIVFKVNQVKEEHPG